MGKTTTLAKLAMRLARAGRRVVATLDADRVGAAAKVKAYGEMLRVPAIAVRDVAARRGARPDAGATDAILVDGTGDEAADVARSQAPEKCVAAAPARASRRSSPPATARH